MIGAIIGGFLAGAMVSDAASSAGAQVADATEEGSRRVARAIMEKENSEETRIRVAKEKYWKELLATAEEEDKKSAIAAMEHVFKKFGKSAGTDGGWIVTIPMMARWQDEKYYIGVLMQACLGRPGASNYYMGHVAGSMATSVMISDVDALSALNGGGMITFEDDSQWPL